MTHYASLEDHDLLLLIQKGEEPAFKEVFHRYWEKLVATGYYYTKNKETTEEIVSDVLMSLWNKREDPAAIRSLPAYLGTAVKYAVFKAIVRQKRREELLQGRLRPESDHDTEEQLNARFLKDFLEGAVENLPEKARLVFKYSRDEQLTVSEIAGRMDLSSKSVEYHKTKALKALRNALRKFNSLFSNF